MLSGEKDGIILKLLISLYYIITCHGCYQVTCDHIMITFHDMP